MNRYRIRRQVLDDEAVYELVDGELGFEVSIVPGIGAQAAAFRWQRQGTAVDIFVPPPDLATLRRQPTSFGNPILFPFPGRIPEGRFHFQGKEYRLPLNDRTGTSSIHGIVARLPWKVRAEGSDSQSGAFITCTLNTEETGAEGATFPFPFAIDLTYRLLEGALHCEVQVTNTGDDSMPMGLGFHPWFPLPITASGRREECLLKAPVNRTWVLENLVPTGELRPASPERDLSNGVRLGTLPFDDVYTGLNKQIVSGDASFARSTYTDPAAGISISLLSDANFRELVIYAPIERATVCIEPWTCTPDAFNVAARGIDSGMIILEPGNHWQAEIRFVAELVV